MARQSSFSRSQPSDAVSVGAFTRQVKRLLETQLPPLWIRGEISNLRRQSSGHVYFTLKDSESQVPCALFRMEAMRTSVDLRDGLQVLVLGEVSLYEPRGAYQLICREVMADGEGRLQQEFERLKRKLAAEGLFERERKRELPGWSRRVGFVTSPTGAALRDFCSILRRNGWLGEVVVIPARVQGVEASAEIVRGIELAQQLGDLDILVVGRGGGSLEDLWCFNEEAVARAVAASRVPTISAVGHEIDFALSDFAADVRAETPSAAAEMVARGQLQLLDRLERAARSFETETDSTLEALRNHLMVLGRALRAVGPDRQIESLRLQVGDLRNRLHAATETSLHQLQHRLAAAASALGTAHPSHLCRLKLQEVAALQKRLERATAQAILERQKTLASLEHRLKQSGVQATLDRGFAIIRNASGELVTRKASLEKGERLSADFADGEAIVRVEEV